LQKKHPVALVIKYELKDGSMASKFKGTVEAKLYRESSPGAAVFKSFVYGEKASMSSGRFQRKRNRGYLYLLLGLREPVELFEIRARAKFSANRSWNSGEQKKILAIGYEAPYAAADMKKVVPSWMLNALDRARIMYAMADTLRKIEHTRTRRLSDPVKEGARAAEDLFGVDPVGTVLEGAENGSDILEATRDLGKTWGIMNKCAGAAVEVFGAGWSVYSASNTAKSMMRNLDRDMRALGGQISALGTNLDTVASSFETAAAKAIAEYRTLKTIYYLNGSGNLASTLQQEVKAIDRAISSVGSAINAVTNNLNAMGQVPLSGALTRGGQKVLSALEGVRVVACQQRGVTEVLRRYAVREGI